MTSSEGLLSLVNQLQNMETAMGLFLIETALKLSTFHDTKFFVMVDLPEGRKIAGKTEMIQSFVEGQLLPTPSDAKIELNPSVSALVEIPLRGGITPTPVSMFSSNSAKQDSRPFRPYPPASFRQPYMSSYDSSVAAMNRSAVYDAAGPRSVKSPKMSSGGALSPKVETPYDGISSSGRKRAGQPGSLYDPAGVASPKMRKEELKIEGGDAEESSVVGDDEDDSLQEIYPDDDNHAGVGGGDDYVIPSSVAQAHLAGSVKSYSPFATAGHHHHSDLNSEDHAHRIALAQQFSYDDVKAKDSTGFKVIASIVYAKAKELAAECPIPNYKGPEVNNYLRQEYLAWFAATFPRLYDTKATALFRARMQICFQTIRKKLFPPQPSPQQQQHAHMGAVATASSVSQGMGGMMVPSTAPSSASGTSLGGGTGYPDRAFGDAASVDRRDEIGHHDQIGQDHERLSQGGRDEAEGQDHERDDHNRALHSANLEAGLGAIPLNSYAVADNRTNENYPF